VVSLSVSGWIIELELVTKPEELDSLMDEAAYAKYLKTWL